MGKNSTKKSTAPEIANKLAGDERNIPGMAENLNIFGQETTEGKSTETILQQNIAFQKILMDAVPVPVYYKDTQGCYIGANKAFFDFYNISEQNLVGKTVFDITPNELALFLHSKDKELFQNPGQQVFETRMLDHKQTPHDVIFHKSTFTNVNGETAGIIGVIQDITDQKAAEQSLRDATEELEHFFSSTLDLLSIADTEGYYRRLNHEWEKVLGYKLEELENHRFLDFVHPDDLKATQDAFSQLKSRIDLINFRNRIRCKDGSYRWIEWQSKTVDNNIYAAARDITERLSVEEALRSNEEVLSSLLAATPVGVGLLKNRIFLKVNNALCRITGYIEEELLGISTRIFYPDEDEFNRVGIELYAEMERTGLGTGEARLKRKDGEAIDVILSLSPFDPDDLSKGVTATVLDITDRKQVERALRESEKKYRSVIENIQDVFYRADLNGRVLMGSPSSAKMFGYDSVDEMIGESFLTFWVDPSERQRLTDQIKATGNVKDFETTLKRKDGSTFLASFTTQLYYNDQGHPLGTEGIVRDITERKKAEEEIRQLNEVLEQRVRERTQQLETAVQELEAFSYSVSHDLRAPLRAINGYANILSEDFSSTLNDDGKRICSVIGKETRRMSRLIDDLLSFARLGKVEMQPYSINMEAMVNSVYQELTTPAERQSVTFQVLPLDTSVGDANLIRQVWINLISNALKFSSQKQHIDIVISSRQDEKSVIYSITDNGAGFDMRYAQNLFGVFNRLHSEKEFEGTGVGLAIVQRIVNRHGGHVWAEGDVDKGATFHFSLPKRETTS